MGSRFCMPVVLAGLVMFLSADPLALDEVDLIYNSNRLKDPIGADDD